MSRCGKPSTYVFPETDFRGFIDAVLEANTTGRRILEELGVGFSSNDSLDVIQERSTHRHGRIVANLLERRRDLNAHYGWVLASDARLVYRSMGGTNASGAAWARQWLRTVFVEYEQVGQALVNAGHRLRVY